MIHHAHSRSGPRLTSRVAALGAAALLLLTSCSMFDTNISNPNAIDESALSDPASAPTLANGLNATVTRMITSVYGPYSVASDELTWVGSRENWGKIDAGDVSDPTNEYNDAAYPLASQARWLSNYTIQRLEGFSKAGTLKNSLDLARTYVYAAITYITIGENYDDFILASDRTKPAAPVGEANMIQMFDSATAYLDRALPIATAASNTDLQSQILGLRARAKFSKALWKVLKPARTTPANPLINDATANADATAALAIMPTGYRFRVTPTTANTGTNNVGSEMNSRQEIRAGGDYINPDPARSNLQPLPGAAGIKLKDPITQQPDPVIAKAIDDCCRVSSTTLLPFTLTSWKEMQLILAEASLASGNAADFKTRINAIRASDALPAWDGTTPAAQDILIHERRVNLFLQSRRLHDLYRFGLKADRWLPTSIASKKACFFPITAIERQSNPLAPQPVSERSPSCTP
jgi:starch-binding outer membrane protein, SusD/RagB family